MLAVGWLTTPNDRSQHHIFGSKRPDEMMPFLSVPFAQWMEGGPYGTFRIHQGRLYVLQTHGDAWPHRDLPAPLKIQGKVGTRGGIWAPRGWESMRNDEERREVRTQLARGDPADHEAYRATASLTTDQKSSLWN